MALSILGGLFVDSYPAAPFTVLCVGIPSWLPQVLTALAVRRRDSGGEGSGSGKRKRRAAGGWAMTPVVHAIVSAELSCIHTAPAPGPSAHAADQIDSRISRNDSPVGLHLCLHRSTHALCLALLRHAAKGAA